jgi:hypothetical protein
MMGRRLADRRWAGAGSRFLASAPAHYPATVKNTRGARTGRCDGDPALIRGTRARTHHPRSVFHSKVKGDPPR